MSFSKQLKKVAKCQSEDEIFSELYYLSIKNQISLKKALKKFEKV